MKVSKCSHRPILEPCSLQDYSYQVDPYIGCEHHCLYCYALNRAETDWTMEILIHSDIYSQLSQELDKLETSTIYLGWNSDPYQPCEVDCCQTRQVLELLARRGFAACILTKSDLVTRDMDLLAQMPGSSVGFSFAFTDEVTRRLFEVNAPSNDRRLAALRRFKEAGIETYVLITPVMPFFSDLEALIEMVEPYANTIWVYALSMHLESDRNWQFVREILDHHFPELTEIYRQAAFSTSHPYWDEVRWKTEQIQNKKHLDLRVVLLIMLCTLFCMA
jgi:DNA repair photolyase